MRLGDGNAVLSLPEPTWKAGPDDYERPEEDDCDEAYHRYAEEE